MKKQSYKEQVSLLLTVLPEVAKEENLAMHGGTAINLFVRDMPRVSVDIDLTYLLIDDRATSLKNIEEALQGIKLRVEKLNQDINVDHKKDEGKLLISKNDTIIKLEVNLIIRGIISPIKHLSLCQKAQNEFNSFCEMPIVSLGQLNGGKICAALDRQHPRDLFDVKYILENEGFTDEIKRGLLFCLLSSARPIHELLGPHLQDQREALENQFDGMTGESFTYEDYETTRTEMVEMIHKNLSDKDKEFLLAFNRLEPIWDKYDFQEFPSVRWKLINLQKLKETHPEKFEEQCNSLDKILQKTKT